MHVYFVVQSYEKLSTYATVLKKNIFFLLKICQNQKKVVTLHPEL